MMRRFLLDLLYAAIAAALIVSPFIIYFYRMKP